MDVSVVETSGLGDRSYPISDGDAAVVIDPHRDIDRVLAAASERGVRITHVLEYRASVAASLLDQKDRGVVLDDEFDNAGDLVTA